MILYRPSCLVCLTLELNSPTGIGCPSYIHYEYSIYTTSYACHLHLDCALQLTVSPGNTVCQGDMIMFLCNSSSFTTFVRWGVFEQLSQLQQLMTITHSNMQQELMPVLYKGHTFYTFPPFYWSCVSQQLPLLNFMD